MADRGKGWGGGTAMDKSAGPQCTLQAKTPRMSVLLETFLELQQDQVKFFIINKFIRSKKSIKIIFESGLFLRQKS